MAKKIALKLGYESPFAVYSIFSTQRDYRIAWLLNEQLGLQLERIKDYSHQVADSKTSTFPLFCFDYQQYRMHVFLLGNKSSEGSIIGENPVPDYLLLLLNPSEFFDQKEFLKNLRKVQQIQTVISLNEKVLKKHETFFYDLEYFLTELSII